MATDINKQACESFAFDQAESEELGLTVIVPDAWNALTDKSPEQSLKRIDTGQPKYFPIGFIGIVEANWKDTGVVLVNYD